MKKKRSVYGLWLILLFVLFVLFQNTFFGAIFFTYTSMGIISVIIARAISKGVTVSIQATCDSIEEEGSFLFNIIAKNTSIFPSNKVYARLSVKNYFFGEQEEECMVNVPITIKGEEIITSSIECKYVGNVKVSLKEVIVKDFVGLVSYKVLTRSSFDVNVLPREVDVKIKAITKAADEDESALDAIDSLEAYDIKEVREYKDGESLHRIHWNLSARFDEFMIKEYEVETISRFNIMIDLCKDNIIWINEVIEAMCSVIKVVSNVEKEFKVYWYDGKTELVRQFRMFSVSDIPKLLEEIYASGIATKSGEVYYNIADDTLDLVNAIYITSDRTSVNGEIIGELDNKVVLMCV